MGQGLKKTLINALSQASLIKALIKNFEFTNTIFMQKILIAMVATLLTLQVSAQTDSTKKEQTDTIHVGNFIIIQKNKDKGVYDSSDKREDHHYSFDVDLFSKRNRNKNHSNVSTNWFICDLGFTNWRDQTAYGTPAANSFLHTFSGGPFTKSDLTLTTAKSTNVNVWFFMQKLNVTHHIVNLKYGLGMEMYNFRYENNISYNKNPVYIFRDTVNFTKDKLYASYLTVPLMLNINATPDRKRGFSFSMGFSAGYRLGTHTKQKSDARGKQKLSGDFDLDPWRLAYIAELGIGPVRLYGSYSINALQQDAVVQYPYALGIRFSNW